MKQRKIDERSRQRQGEHTEKKNGMETRTARKPAIATPWERDYGKEIYGMQ